ncbi:DNA cytosine methyltransferase [Exiguobacterium sp. s195]|uniref:DNA cytosine methyltransferase n=1 Tax=Exiguobacterium sp. s195 TaxID=2751282 RepID=UPI001BE57A94|nr:DNA cytosine methyltransferase [Exiguobacterium sp. s195]
MEDKKINALDLFSGAGGFSLGMELAGINVVAAVEYDDKIAKTYEYNHPHTIMINEDIRKVPALKKDITEETISVSIEEIFKEKESEIDIIFGGPPCQGFSMAGYRIRNHKPFFEDERNLLYLEYLRMVEKLMPKVFIIENVPGILNFSEGKIYDEITEKFEKLGYDVHAKILSAEKFGVPQKRKRAFFIGNRLGKMSKNLFPEDTLSPEQYTSVWSALSDLPSLESGQGSEPSHYGLEAQNEYQKMMRANIDDRGFYNHISSIHKPMTIELLKMIKPGETMKNLPENLRTKSVHSGAYGRMNPNEPAYTITTRLNTPSVGRITHPIDHRTITPREAARIQSFPDNYRFLGDITTIGMQIGNSVPPLLAKKIGENIVELFQMSLKNVF